MTNRLFVWKMTYKGIILRSLYICNNYFFIDTQFISLMQAGKRYCMIMANKTKKRVDAYVTLQV